MTTLAPRSFPDGRYSLEELEYLIPTLAQDNGPATTGRLHTGKFDPHLGQPLVQEDRVRLEEFLGKLGLQQNSDGRYAGTCPLPHRDGPATSERSFYCSPVTGFWHCFGSNHVGERKGGISALRLIGFECELPAAALSLAEIASLLGQDSPSAFYKQGQKGNVPNTVKGLRGTFTVLGTNTAEKRKDRGKGASLWSDAVVLFPYPKGIRPLTKSTVLYSGRAQLLAVVDFLSNSWRNPFNAQYKRRKAYFNMLPKLRKGEVYCLRVAVDDWDKRVHATIKKQLERAGAEWLYFDNGLRRGCHVYLSNVPPLLKRGMVVSGGIGGHDGLIETGYLICILDSSRTKAAPKLPLGFPLYLSRVSSVGVGSNCLNSHGPQVTLCCPFKSRKWAATGLWVQSEQNDLARLS